MSIIRGLAQNQVLRGERMFFMPGHTIWDELFRRNISCLLEGHVDQKQYARYSEEELILHKCMACIHSVAVPTNMQCRNIRYKIWNIKSINEIE